MNETIKYERKKINSMGMELDHWTLKSCVASIGTGDTFATIYYIESKEQNKGHASDLINIMKEVYLKEGKDFGTSVALSESMKYLVKKLNLKEYK